MAHITITVSSLLVLLLAGFSFQLAESNPAYVAEREEWWKFADQYTDLPRYFGAVEGCPAPQFYLDCNRCRCGEGSQHAACTLIGCPPVPQIANFGVNGQGCPAGQQFYHQCNSCRCGNDGKTAACTLKLCISPPSEE